MPFNSHKDARFLIKPLWAVLAITFLFGSCGVRKIIPKDEHLLIKNKVVVNGPKSARRNAKAQILHRTNKRVLFNRLPIFLWLYAIGTNNKHPEKSDSVSWRKKFRQDFGEEPVLFKPSLADISSNNIKFHLFNQGYFDATCSYVVKQSKRKARVTYIAEANQPYLLDKIEVVSFDSATKEIMEKAIEKEPNFRLWWPCNLNSLSAAQERIALSLRDSGFFTVSSEYIQFEIDTNQIEKHASVNVILKPFKDTVPHRKYTIGQVHVEIVTSEVYQKNRYPDSLTLPGKNILLNHYPLKRTKLEQILTLDSGSTFSQTNWSNSYRKLIDLGVFSFVDVSERVDHENRIIYPSLNLKTYPRMVFIVEPQLLYSPQGSSGLNFQSSSQRSFGLAGILSFNNRNTFGRGEYFKLSSITSYEAIFKKTDIGDFFTGIQQGLVASLKLPKFSFLKRFPILNSFDHQNTLVTTSFQYEQNPNFSRSSIPANITLQFAKERFSWYYTPLEISYNRNIIDPSFLPQLPKLDQDFVLRVFTDQITTPVKLGMIYADNQNKPGSTSHFLRLGFETSGNWHHYYRKLTEANYQPDSSYQLFGVNYFQYTKLEAEYRIKRNIDELNTIAMRVNTGIAIPYGNSSLVPYDKRYFIGGSNSLRGWQPRGLGPGNTPRSVTSLIDRSGEFLIEANLEYRFTIIRKLLESAIFFDAGNIWNLSEESTSNSNYGVISRDKFFSEIALNTGIGLRFDLSIFLFRVDWGIPIRDPSLPNTQRWILTESLNNRNFGSYLLNETSIAIGIGYPF